MNNFGNGNGQQNNPFGPSTFGSVNNSSPLNTRNESGLQFGCTNNRNHSQAFGTFGQASFFGTAGADVFPSSPPSLGGNAVIQQNGQAFGRGSEILRDPFRETPAIPNPRTGLPQAHIFGNAYAPQFSMYPPTAFGSSVLNNRNTEFGQSSSAVGVHSYLSAPGSVLLGNYDSDRPCFGEGASAFPGIRQPQVGTKNVKWKVTTLLEGPNKEVCKYHAISMMTPLRGKSFEELRLEDYRIGNRSSEDLPSKASSCFASHMLPPTSSSEVTKEGHRSAFRGFMQPQFGTKGIEWKATKVLDNVSGKVLKYHSINMMAPLRGRSLEELRLEDYSTGADTNECKSNGEFSGFGNSAPPVFSSPTFGAFGNGNAFGPTSTLEFGCNGDNARLESNSNEIFGQNPAGCSSAFNRLAVFGSSNTLPFPPNQTAGIATDCQGRPGFGNPQHCVSTNSNGCFGLNATGCGNENNFMSQNETVRFRSSSIPGSMGNTTGFHGLGNTQGNINGTRPISTRLGVQSGEILFENETASAPDTQYNCGFGSAQIGSGEMFSLPAEFGNQVPSGGAPFRQTRNSALCLEPPGTPFRGFQHSSDTSGAKTGAFSSSLPPQGKSNCFSGTHVHQNNKGLMSFDGGFRGSSHSTVPPNIAMGGRQSSQLQTQATPLVGIGAATGGLSEIKTQSEANPGPSLEDTFRSVTEDNGGTLVPPGASYGVVLRNLKLLQRDVEEQVSRLRKEIKRTVEASPEDKKSMTIVIRSPQFSIDFGSPASVQSARHGLGTTDSGRTWGKVTNSTRWGSSSISSPFSGPQKTSRASRYKLEMNVFSPDNFKGSSRRPVRASKLGLPPHSLSKLLPIQRFEEGQARTDGICTLPENKFHEN